MSITHAYRFFQVEYILPYGRYSTHITYRINVIAQLSIKQKMYGGMFIYKITDFLL